MALDTTIDASEAWRTIKGNGKAFRNNVPADISTLSSQSVTVEFVFEIYRKVRASRNQLETLKATANLDEYVQSVKGDNTYSAVAQINAVTSAQLSVLDWIDTNAAGLSLTGDTAENALANNSIVTNRFGASATAPLRTLLQSAVDAIAG